MIRFDLSITLDYIVQSPSDFVFVMQPTNTPYQRVTWERLVHRARHSGAGRARRLARATATCACTASPGPLRVRYDAIVDLVHHFALPSDIREVPIAELPAAVLQYIYPSRYCQSDRLLNVARNEFGAMAPGYERVEAIRKWVQVAHPLPGRLEPSGHLRPRHL